ncbi:MAG: hypothetical protein ABI347_07125 [Nitrososphaera sp.]
MTTLSVRISEKEKAALKKHGKISKVVKEAIAMYLDLERSNETLRRLKELQSRESPQRTGQQEAELVREDRRR